MSLAAATVVLLDEWVGLPPGDPARCDVRLRRELLDRLATPPAFVPIDVDGPDDDAAAAAHDAMAARPGPGRAGPGDERARRVQRARPAPTTRRVWSGWRVVEPEAATARYGASITPTAGITVGLARLLEAGECWLLVTGERKAQVLRRALEQPEGPDCPASYLRRHPRLTVFADEAAASLLRAG